jgi:hypothetical protein
MPAAFRRSPRHPGDVLRPLAEELWLVEGPSVPFLGLFPYPTRMAVIRLDDGGLWIWSPVGLDEALAAELASLGPVRHLVAPNKLHHQWLADWARHFPEARLYAAPGLARKRRDLHFHAELGDAPPAAWRDRIDQVVFRGSFFMDEVVFFHHASRTALVCDLVQRFDPDSLRGLRGLLMRLDGLVGPDGSTPREWRASWWNRRAGREALRTALAWSPARLVIAHGMLPEGDGREALSRGLRWLL